MSNLDTLSFGESNSSNTRSEFLAVTSGSSPLSLRFPENAFVDFLSGNNSGLNLAAVVDTI